MTIQNGWKPIPLSLKILFILFVIWAIGSIVAVPARYEFGLPFFGAYVYGILASSIVIFLDIVAPIIFLFTVWRRKSWGPLFALLYISIFILNSIFAFFTISEQLGVFPILMPLIINLIFLAIIYQNRNYFK